MLSILGILTAAPDLLFPKGVFLSAKLETVADPL